MWEDDVWCSQSAERLSSQEFYMQQNYPSKEEKIKISQNKT